MQTGNRAANHEVAGLSFDAARLEERKKTLGASEIAAVVGLDRYRTRLEVYLDKKGLMPPFAGNEFTEWGLRLEDIIVQKYEQTMGVLAAPSGTLTSPNESWASATPDRIITQYTDVAGAYGDRATLYGLECKNKSVHQIVHWGETASDNIPHEVATQCHWGMIVTGFPWWDAAVLFGGNQFRHYRLHRNDEIQSTLLEQGRSFWFDNVLAGVEPDIDGSKAAADYLKQRFTSHTELVRDAGPDEVKDIVELVRVRENIKELEETENFYVNRLKAAISDAAGVKCRVGRATWKAPKPSRIIDWESVAVALQNRFNILDTEFTDCVNNCTNQRENSRRFLLTIPKD